MNETLLIGIIFSLGAVLGSWTNVLILRSRAVGGRNKVEGSRSQCPSCRNQLSWWELVPILSFVLLRGRCRYCGNSISVQYPIVELALGVWALIVFIPLPDSVLGIVQAVLLMFIGILLAVLFVIDLKTFYLPDEFVGVLTLLAIVSVALEVGSSEMMWRVLSMAILGVLLGAGLLLVLWMVTRGQGLGFGDVKIMVPLGLLTGGFGVLFVLFLAFLMGGVLGVYLLWRGRAGWRTAVPFGPFLIGAASLALIWPSLVSFFWRDILSLPIVGTWL